MRAKFVIPVLASILILGLIGFPQETKAASMTFTTDTTITVTKQVINDDGGNLPPDDFTLLLYGNGIEDLIVGEYFGSDLNSASGAVWTLFMNDDETVDTHQKISNLVGSFSGEFGVAENFGSSISSLGDVDGDGVNDVAVGASGNRDNGVFTGAVWILFLNNDGTVKGHQKISHTDGNLGSPLDSQDRFGTSVSGLGDLDNDGVPDLAVGAPGDDDAGSDRGAIWILFLNSDGTVKSHHKITQSEPTIFASTGSSMGRGLANLGDFNGDNIVDLAFTASNGYIFLLYLNTDGTVNTSKVVSQFPFSHGTVTSGFGVSLANIGDLDDDGVTDIAIGDDNDDDGGSSGVGSNTGALWILFLNADGSIKSTQKISATQGSFVGPLADGDAFGISIAGVGDLSGDGVEDIAVGAYRDDDAGFNNGAIWLLFLDSNGIVSGEAKITTNQGGFTGILSPTGHFGKSIATLGDLDGVQVINGIPNNIPPGTYSVSERLSFGYSATFAANDDCDENGNFVINTGDELNCTIINDDIPIADLAVFKIANDDVVPDGEFSEGEAFTYSITAINFGPSTASNVIVTDTLPLEVTFVSASDPSCSNSLDVVTCNLGDMISNQQIIFEIEVTIDANFVGFISNGLSITSNALDLSSSTFLLEFDSALSLAGPLDQPNDVATNSMGDIYVVDTNNNRIQVFDSNGIFKFEFDSSGSAAGTLNNPTGIAIDSSERVIVSDTNNNQIQIFDKDGNFLELYNRYFSGSSFIQFLFPRGIALDSSDNIYFLDNNAGSKVLVIEPTPVITANTATLLLNFRNDFDNPTDIDVDTSGRIYVADTNHNRFQVFDQFGTLLFVVPAVGTAPTTFDSPQGIAIDKFGTLFVTDTNNNRIKAYSNDGTFLYAFGLSGSAAGQLNQPTGISVDETGNLYVSDTGNNRIQIFSISHSNSNSLLTEVELREADLNVVKTVDRSTIIGTRINEGESFDYTVTVTNVGPDVAQNVVLTDTLPLEVTFVSASDPSCSHSIGIVTCNLGDMDPNVNGVTTVDITVTVDVGFEGTLSNQVSVTSDIATQFSGDDSLTLETNAFLLTSDLLVVKALDPSSLADGILNDGDTFSYEITVKNFGGPEEAQNVVLTDTLPPEVTFVSASDPSCSHFLGIVTCNLGDINIDVELSINIISTVDTGFDGVLTNTASVVIDNNDPPFNAIHQFTQDTPLSGVTDIAVNSTGHIFVLDGSTIDIFDSLGNLVTSFGLDVSDGGPLSGIQTGGISIDRFDNIYVSESDRVVVFDNTNSFQFEFDSSGSPAGQLDGASRIAFDSNDNIFVVETSIDPSVQVFDASGAFQFSFGSAGTGDGEFNTPRGIAIDKSNRIYVSDSGNGRIQVFDSTGNFVTKFGIQGFADDQFQSPHDIVIDDFGLIYIADNNKIKVYSPSNDFITTFESNDPQNPFRIPDGLASDGTKLYVSDFSSDIIFAYDFTYQNSHTISSDVELLLADLGIVKEVDKSSIPDGVINPGDTFTYTITVENFGPGDAPNLVVTDTLPPEVTFVSASSPSCSHSLRIVTCTLGNMNSNTQLQIDIEVLVNSGSSGFITNTVDLTSDLPDPIEVDLVLAFDSVSGIGSFNKPFAVAVNSIGEIIIAEDQNDRILVLNPQTDLKFTFGSECNIDNDPNGDCNSGAPGAIEDGDGQFNRPRGVITDNSDNIYVSEAFNNRIQKFDANGIFLSKFGSFCNANILSQECNSNAPGAIEDGDGQFASPHGITLDSSGRLVVADTGNHRIQVFDSSGSFLFKFGSTGNDPENFNAPIGVAVDKFDNIYSVDLTSLKAFDSSGNFLYRVGTFGFGSEPSEFSSPDGIIVDSFGRIFVSDTGNDRIQVFDQFGTFLFEFDATGTPNGQLNSPEALALDDTDRLYVGDQSRFIRIFDTFHTNSFVVISSVVPPPTQPTASFTAIPNPAAPLQLISLDASSSSDVNNDIVSFEWDFDYDGVTFDIDATGVTTSVSYPTFGDRTVALTVTDATSLSDLATELISVSLGNQPPVADAGGPYITETGLGVTLDGSGSFDPDESAGDFIAEYAWDLDNDGIFDDATGVSPDLTVADLSVLPQPAIHNTISLRVTDSFGETSIDTATLTIFENFPTAIFTATPNPAAASQLISFDASPSTHSHPDHSIVDFVWDFGDGTTGTGVSTTHDYSVFGSYTVTLTVTDDNTPPKIDATSLVIDVNEGDLDPFDTARDKIQNLGLQKGIENSLISKINSAEKSFDKGNIKPAVNSVEAFLNKVDAQDGKKISEQDADLLRECGNILIAAIQS